MVKKSLIVNISVLFLAAFIFLVQSNYTFAQIRLVPTTSTAERELEDELATDSASSSPSAEEVEALKKIAEEDVTRPEEPATRDEILVLFERRPAKTLTPLNFAAFFVQESVRAGVPSRTIILILLLPMLATIIAFIRHVVGLPSIGLLVPIALSITLLSTGITAGLILLGSIILGSTFARLILKRLRIMQLPKMALSMFIVSIIIFATITVSAMAGILVVRQLSIFPVLLLILLSEQIISVQIERSFQEMLVITLVTFALGVVGFVVLSAQIIRNTFLLYPELIFLLIPINILIGRYFGLRLLEFFRFTSISRHAGK
jgi:hypothetical protein